MNPLAVLLTVSSAVIHSWREMLTKQAQDKQSFVWLYEIWSLIFFLPLAVYFFVIQGMSLVGLEIVALSGIIHFFYWIYLSKSYETGDLSHVYPIIRSSPALVLILSVLLLHENVSLQGVVGILLILAGIYMINMKGWSLQSFLQPLESFREAATRFALITSVTVAAYSITDDLGVHYLHPVLYVYFLTVFSMVLYTPYVFLTRSTDIVRREWNANKRMILMNGFFVMFGYLLILIAYTFERVSYVSGLRQISIVFGVLLGGHFLREKYKSIRFTAAAVILVGAVLISTAS